MYSRDDTTNPSIAIYQELIDRLLRRNLEDAVFRHQFLNLRSDSLSDQKIADILNQVGNTKKIFDAIIYYLNRENIKKILGPIFHKGVLAHRLLAFAASHGYYGEYQQQVPFRERMLYQYFELCREYQLSFISYNKPDFERKLVGLLIDSVEFGDFETAEFLIEHIYRAGDVTSNNTSLFCMIAERKLEAKANEDDAAHAGYTQLLNRLLAYGVRSSVLLKDIVLLTKAGLTSQQIAEQFSRKYHFMDECLSLFKEKRVYELRILKRWLLDQLRNPENKDETNPFAVAECTAYLEYSQTYCAEILMRGVKNGEHKENTKSYKTYQQIMQQVRLPGFQAIDASFQTFYSEDYAQRRFPLLKEPLLISEAARSNLLQRIYNRGFKFDNRIGRAKIYDGNVYPLLLLAYIVAAPDIQKLEFVYFIGLWHLPLEGALLKERLRGCMATLTRDERKQLNEKVLNYIDTDDRKDEMKQSILSNHRDGTSTVLTEVLKMGLDTKVSFETEAYLRLIRMFDPGYQTPTLFSRAVSIFAKPSTTERDAQQNITQLSLTMNQ